MTAPAPVAPPESTVVVSTAWLAARLAPGGSAEPLPASGRSSGPAGGEDLCVVDVRGLVRPVGQNPRYLPKRAEYDAAHIPGAVFVDWTRDIVDVDDPVPVQVAPPERFAALMSALGIGEKTLVVAYDDYEHAFAGRFAWALRYHGHDAVRLLDGGWPRWIAEARPTSAEVVKRAPAVFVPRVRTALRRSADEVERTLGKPGVLLIDARPAEQY
ncbi:MAG: sulfurtransferase, partial [Polyangiaceae bacterium]